MRTIHVPEHVTTSLCAAQAPGYGLADAVCPIWIARHPQLCPPAHLAGGNLVNGRYLSLVAAVKDVHAWTCCGGLETRKTVEIRGCALPAVIQSQEGPVIGWVPVWGPTAGCLWASPFGCTAGNFAEF